VNLGAKNIKYIGDRNLNVTIAEKNELGNEYEKSSLLPHSLQFSVVIK